MALFAQHYDVTKAAYEAALKLDPRSGLDLKILERFRAEEEWILEPGDMLYLPPGIAHHGIAESECLTWSIGFRAPGDAEPGPQSEI